MEQARELLQEQWPCLGPPDPEMRARRDKKMRFLKTAEYNNGTEASKKSQLHFSPNEKIASSRLADDAPLQRKVFEISLRLSNLSRSGGWVTKRGLLLWARKDTEVGEVKC